MPQSAQPATSVAAINGAQIHYEIAGTGHPLVLLHAGVADHTMWDAVWPALTARYRAIRYDARGFGASDLPPQPYALHDDLHALLQHLGVARAHLIGVSVGGSTVVDFALAHPESVGALIPVAAGVSGQPRDESGAAAYAPFEAAYAAHDLEGLLDLEMALWLAGPGRRLEDIAPALREHFRTMERRNLTNEFARDPEPDRTPLDPPAWDRLGAIRAPTLVIVGDQDVPPVLIAARHLAATIPGAHKVVLPNVAHMVPMEAPDPFSDLVLAFLDAL